MAVFLVAYIFAAPAFAWPTEAGELASPATLQRSAYAVFERRSVGDEIRIVGVAVTERQSATTTAFYSLFTGWCLEDYSSLEECVVDLGGFRTGKLALDQYRIDPLMRHARVSFKTRGRPHEIRWKAAEPSRPEVFETHCEDGEPSVAAGAAFSAQASGRLGGPAVVSQLGSISTYTYASGC